MKLNFLDTSGVPVIVKDGRLNFLALIKAVIIKKKVIGFVTIAFILVGLLIALCSPVTYRTSTVILPQTSGSSGLGQLGGLASIAGVNLGSFMEGGEAVSPELYPDIISSYPFLWEVANTSFDFPGFDEPISYYEKMRADSVKSFGELVVDYTVKLPWTIRDLFRGDEKLVTFVSEKDSSLIVVDIETQRLLQQIEDNISLRVNSQNRLVTIAFEEEGALLSAQVTSYLAKLLEEFVINYKNEQIKENLNFFENILEDKKVEFQNAQKALFAYRDRYRNRVPERQNIEYQELDDNYRFAMSSYQNLAQQVEQYRVSSQKEVPLFSVIEPVKIPVEKYAPKRLFILIVSTISGVFVGIVAVFGILWFVKIKDEWNNLAG
ncbi:Wzz/FepE/Etk N-terminal domain-containing protein [Marinilabiliaceae bacterium ANBcel2]|nr:Wzz/FepE/Etk N-terminal domain-containing protein [Marinilabiliaceae bacterium ANBcel2]